MDIILSLEVRSLEDFDSAFAQAKRDGAQALITVADPLKGPFRLEMYSPSTPSQQTICPPFVRVTETTSPKNSQSRERSGGWFYWVCW